MHIIAIAGGSGAGKTTFAKKLSDVFSENLVTTIHLDSYYLPRPDESLFTSDGAPNFDHPNSFDWKLIKQHLAKLKKGSPIELPHYDFNLHRRTQKLTTIPPKKVLLFEGIYSFYNSAVRELLDVKCFMHTDSDLRFIRRMHRDIKERGRTVDCVTEQYCKTVRPMYVEYLSTQKRFADIVIGENLNIATKILTAYIHSVLKE